jgi:hypothetical protein
MVLPRKDSLQWVFMLLRTSVLASTLAPPKPPEGYWTHEVLNPYPEYRFLVQNGTMFPLILTEPELKMF